MPSSIALHDRLEALDIRDNALSTVPSEWNSAAKSLIAQSPLVYLRIADNQFQVSSAAGSLSTLRELASLALALNLCNV